MIAWVLIVMLLTQAPAGQRIRAAELPFEPVNLSPEVATLVAPVADAIEAERKAQAALPPADSDAERLIRMGKLDQVGRLAMIPIDLHTLSPADRSAAQTAIWTPIMTVDKANQEQLLAMLPPDGWFYRSRYGPEAGLAAFLIIQHSNAELWKRFVPVFEPLVAKGEVSGPDYALMYDRLAIAEGRPQRYGSQMTCKASKWVVDTLEAPETVDERRKAMGFQDTLAHNASRFASWPPC